MHNYPVPKMDSFLGSHYDLKTKKTQFAIWAPNAFSVKLNAYKNQNAQLPDLIRDLSFSKEDGVWRCSISDVDLHLYAYDYCITSVLGEKRTLDPYAKSMTAFRNDGSMGRGIIISMDAKESFSIESSHSCQYISLGNKEDAIIYEVSVRDFTISKDASLQSSVKPGTMAAFIQKIPYLKNLGITHIQLMPILKFYFTDELSQEYENKGTVHNNNYNWGYDPHNYFSIEGWLSEKPSDPYARIRELRSLCDACHREGLAVILDVVYNHMATVEFLQRIVPGYYFRTDANGFFTSNSGCGNDTASERPMVKRLIGDSLEFLVKEYGIDGFRFDLMGLMEASSVLEGFKRVSAINPCTLFIGEGWKMYNGENGTVGLDQDYMHKTLDISVFNDEYRDLLKAGGLAEEGNGFITNKAVSAHQLFQNCRGNPQQYFSVSSPFSSVNYISCHDGLTLHDTIAHNCALDDKNPNEQDEIIARIKIGNFFIFTSRGIPFLHSGQERGRTKPAIKGCADKCLGRFVRDSYDSSDNINCFVWKCEGAYENVLSYTKKLIMLRKDMKIFRRDVESAFLLHAKEDISLVLAYCLKEKKSDRYSYVVAINAQRKESIIALPSFSKGEIVFDKDGATKGSGVSFEKSNASMKVSALTAVVVKLYD